MKKNTRTKCLEHFENNNRESELMRPLANYLLPIRKELDMKRQPLENRFTMLNKKDFKPQYKAGITRCMGFDIVWR